MEFIGKTYHFKNSSNGHGMKIQITKKNSSYIAKSEFIHPESGNPKTLEIPVTISSNMFVESPAINVKDHLNEIEVETIEWKINSRIVDEIKVKCKFKGTKMSGVSTILVKHAGMDKWVSYPFSMIGELVTDE